MVGEWNGKNNCNPSCKWSYYLLSVWILWIQVPSTRKIKEVSSRRGDGGAQDPWAGWKEQGQPLSVERKKLSVLFDCMFLVFCLEIIFFNLGWRALGNFYCGLESPKSILCCFIYCGLESPKSTLGFCYRKRSHDGGDIEATYNYNIL